MSHRKTPAVFATALRIFAATTMLFSASAAQATLLGQSVGGVLTGEGGAWTSVPFVTPATVGVGPEFSGAVQDGSGGPPTGNPLDVSVDIFAATDTFIIDTFVNGQWGGVFFNQGFSVSLTDLLWSGAPGVITDVQLIGRLGDTQKWDLTNQNLIKFDADSIGIQLLLLGTGKASGRAAFEFGITTSHVTVPEPAAAALLFFGLVGMGFRRSTRT